MGFTFLKILQRLILPPAGILLLMLFGFLLVRSRRSLGRMFIAAGFLLLYGLSIGPAASALIAPLEKDFRPVNLKSAKADCVVVLGGGTRDRSWLGLGPEPGEASIQRVLEAVELYRVLHIPVLLSGGSGDPAQPHLSDAEAMARTALDLGVPKKDTLIDNRSRNTLESARAVKDMLNEKRIILVTSAYHMKRSVALFRKQGIEVVPAPVGFRSEQRPLTFFSFIPSIGNLSSSSLALAEHLSLGWYAMTGDL
ncbi:MAG: YdcF family protein [Nitrospirota bacterium]